MFTSKTARYVHFVNEHYTGVLKLQVEYVTYTSDYVCDSDKGTLKTLEVVVRTDAEYASFFKKVTQLMAAQCDCPAGGDDLQINLCQIFKVTCYRTEKEFVANEPRTHVFMNFFEKFYERVHELRCR